MLPSQAIPRPAVTGRSSIPRVQFVALHLRNTLTGRVEPVVPTSPTANHTPPRVRMYTCGPTVYRYAHVGNLRSYLLADLIRRVLEYHGTSVLHVKNITDVGHMREERLESGGDRVVSQAASEGRSPRGARRVLRGRVPARTKRSSTSCRRITSRAPPSTSRG
jgi:cysteinyl-tRNA synthetase